MRAQTRDGPYILDSVVAAHAMVVGIATSTVVLPRASRAKAPCYSRVEPGVTKAS